MNIRGQLHVIIIYRADVGVGVFCYININMRSFSREEKSS